MRHPSAQRLRRVLAASFVLALLFAPARALLAQDRKDAAREVFPPGFEQVIDRGLSFLQRQQKSNGSFDANGPAHAMSALAILAFLASGHVPDLGKYGLNVRNAVDWLLAQAPEDGYFGRDGGRMYSHCIVTLALAQVYGTEADETQRAKVRATLEKALQRILLAQEARKDKGAEGGWRYEPKSADSDLSVTCWALAALQACRNAGLHVPPDRIERALAYVLQCYRPEQGGFAYLPGAQASPAMTGAALLTLHLANAHDRPQAAMATGYLINKPARDSQYYYYALYATTHAAFAAGDYAWAVVWKNSIDQLLPAQRKDDGSWPPRPNEPGGEHKSGRFYSTAMALLTLSVPQRLLPLYQAR